MKFVIGYGECISFEDGCHCIAINTVLLLEEEELIFPRATFYHPTDKIFPDNLNRGMRNDG